MCRREETENFPPPTYSWESSRLLAYMNIRYDKLERACFSLSQFDQDLYIMKSIKATQTFCRMFHGLGPLPYSEPELTSEIKM